jgi:hypothetical protein
VLRRVGIALITVLLAGSAGVAQFKPRYLSGTVTDKRGNPLPRAIVQLENTANLYVRSYITGKDGVYYFNDLSDDVEFTLLAKYRNYRSKPKTLSKFDSSEHPEIDLVIPIE